MVEVDGFEDGDGVPELDNDHDGVPDGSDGSALLPEDRDGFQDLDGTPETDNDQDGIVDAEDECPLAPGRAQERGCPRSIHFDADAGTIAILERVEFATGRDVISPQSFPILEEVRAVLVANPQIARLRIEGHTDDRGVDSRNLELSRRRAASVLRWLTAHEVAATRLEAWGCGELHPAQTNMTNEGRQVNRRVEFILLEPTPPAGVQAREGCLQAQ